jgi:hypothetical protein
MRTNIDSEWMKTKDKSFLNELHYTLLCNHYCSKLHIIFLKDGDFGKVLSEFHLTLVYSNATSIRRKITSNLASN